MIQAFYVNVKYSADAIHSDRLRRQPGRRHGLSRHRLGPRNMPLEANAGERVPSRARAGVRQRRAGSWESVLSGQLDGVRHVSSYAIQRWSLPEYASTQSRADRPAHRTVWRTETYDEP